MGESREEMLSSLCAVVEYARKDGGHGWVVMAAFDSRAMADAYAESVGRRRGDGRERPWIYRVVDLPEATP